MTHRIRSAASLWLLLACAIAMPACSATTTSAPEAATSANTGVIPSTAKEGVPMTTPPSPVANAAKPPDGPELTPEQVWGKLLDLVESLHSEADLNRAHIERVIGLPLADRPGERFSQYIAGNTTANWRYIFDFLTYNQDDLRMSFAAYLPDLNSSTKVSPTCTFTFQQLHDELVARGFKAFDVTSAADRMYSWTFSRHPLVLNTYYYFVQPQEIYEADYRQACVSRVSMSFLIPEEQLR